MATMMSFASNSHLRVLRDPVDPSQDGVELEKPARYNSVLPLTSDLALSWFLAREPPPQRAGHLLTKNGSPPYPTPVLGHASSRTNMRRHLRALSLRGSRF